MNSGRSGEAGFTLVELLVSLALLSLMALYVLNSFSQMQQMKAISREQESLVEVHAVMQQFEREVNSLTPIFVTDDNAASKLFFEGQHDKITYAITSDGTRETGGLYRVTWMLDLNHQLIVERRMLNSTTEDIRPLVVLQGVTSLVFVYGYDQPTWIDQQTLPRGIQMKLATLSRGLVERRTSITAAQDF